MSPLLCRFSNIAGYNNIYNKIYNNINNCGGLEFKGILLTTLWNNNESEQVAD